MKEIFIIRDNLVNKISYYHLLAFMVMLPFDRFYSELVLISLVIHTVIHLKKQQVKSIPIQLFIFCSLFLLTIFCTFYSSDLQQAFKDWEKQLAIVLFPFIFSVTSLKVKKYKLQLLKAFSITNLITSIYLYIDAIRVMAHNDLPFNSILQPVFTSHYFSQPIGLHATYFSMYISVSLLAMVYLAIKSSKMTQSFFFITGSIILLLTMIQLQSRSVLIASLLTLNFVVPWALFAQKNRVKILLLFSAFPLLIAFYILQSNAFKRRFITELKADLSQTDGDIHTAEPRAARWACAWELIKKSPLTGYGSGSEVQLLKEKYFEKHFYVSFLNELNAHNEYLSITIKFGMAGLFVYLHILAIAFANGLKKKDIFMTGFVIIVSIVSLSENILDTNKGIFFFSFFLSFFSWPFDNFNFLLFPVAALKRKTAPAFEKSNFPRQQQIFEKK